MKIIDILKRNKDIMVNALSSAIVLKIATDSANAGGVTMEIEVEKAMNARFVAQNQPYLCVSNKGLERIYARGTHTFDFSAVDVETLKQLKDLTKTSDTIASAADLFLFKVNDRTLKLVDCVSFKTSTADSSGSIYLHNDADGSIYESFSTGKHVNVGQVVMLDFSPSSRECNVYYFDGTMQSFSDLFDATEEESGKTTMHGKDLNVVATTAEGKRRTIVSMINRAKAKKKKDGTDKASTSFNRGITISKKSLPFLAKQGVIEEASSFQIAFSLIEGNDFANRYPQL